MLLNRKYLKIGKTEVPIFTMKYDECDDVFV